MTQKNRFAGLRSLLVMENNKWTKSFNWLKSSLIWVLIVNGLILLATSQASLMNAGPIDKLGLDVLFQIFSGICPVGAIIIVHSSLISERDNGTLAWVLSAPVSRVSVIISKLGVNLLYVSSIIIVLQSIIAQLIIQFLSGETLPMTSYYLGVAQMTLYIAFWVTFTLMLNVLLPNRTMVLGVSLGTLFFHGLVSNLLSKVFPLLPRLMPGALLNSALSTAMSGISDSFASLVTLGWIALFILITCLSFQKEEL